MDKLSFCDIVFVDKSAKFFNNFDMGEGNIYRFISDEWSLKVFLNLDFLGFENFLNHPLVVSLIKKDKGFTIQKVWDFFYHNPVCDAWWSGEFVYVDFLVRGSKIRKVYEDLDLFVVERVCPYGISPVDVFDFLKVVSLEEIRYYEFGFRSLEFENCKVCGQKFFVSEIVDLGRDGPYVCVYCYRDMTLEDRISLEDEVLRSRRIEETWRVLSSEERRMLLFSVFKEVLGRNFSYYLLDVKDLVSRVVVVNEFCKVKSMLRGEELLILERKIDELFIIWWKKVEDRELPNET